MKTDNGDSGVVFGESVLDLSYVWSSLFCLLVQVRPKTLEVLEDLLPRSRDVTNLGTDCSFCHPNAPSSFYLTVDFWSGLSPPYTLR